MNKFTASLYFFSLPLATTTQLCHIIVVCSSTCALKLLCSALNSSLFVQNPQTSLIGCQQTSFLPFITGLRTSPLHPRLCSLKKSCGPYRKSCLRPCLMGSSLSGHSTLSILLGYFDPKTPALEYYYYHFCIQIQLGWDNSVLGG